MSRPRITLSGETFDRKRIEELLAQEADLSRLNPA
jgi:hypothetical protein